MTGNLVNGLEAPKVHFQSITDGIDTKTPAGRLFFHVTASLAQMERELMLERTRAGLDAAQQQGRVVGPPGLPGVGKLERLNYMPFAAPGFAEHRVCNPAPVAL